MGADPALGPYIAEMSDDMLSFKSAPRMLQILNKSGMPIAASDKSKRFLKRHGRTNIKILIICRIQQATLT